MLTFDDKTNNGLFGAEDAENEKTDRLKEYFFRNRAYDNLVCGLPIRVIVGHKGVGKSALLKVAYIEDNDANKLTIWLQPNDLKEIAQDNNNNFNQLIEDWKVGIIGAIYSKIVDRAIGHENQPSNQFIRGSISALLAAVDNIFKNRQKDIHGDIAQRVIDNYNKNKSIIVYIDDLDRGWESHKHDIKRISALLNAIRDLTGDKETISFRIGLRSDVYFLVRTSDESTDKIEQNIVWLTWSNHEILTLFAKRIETYFGRAFDETTMIKHKQSVIASYLQSIIIDRFEGYGKWHNAPIHRVLLSLTRRRPRDLVKLFYGAAREAFQNGHNIITTTDLQNTFENYSGERLQDIINEFRTELPEIQKILYDMRPSKREKTTKQSYLYSTGDLLNKLKNVLEHVNCSFTNGEVVTAKNLAEFLYKIDFITARKETEHHIVRRFFEQNRHLQNQFVDFGFHWEIHPAYRWALQPGEAQDIFANLDLED